MRNFDNKSPETKRAYSRYSTNFDSWIRVNYPNIPLKAITNKELKEFIVEKFEDKSIKLVLTVLRSRLIYEGAVISLKESDFSGPEVE